MDDNEFTSTERMATLFSCFFWALSLGVVVLFIWAAAIGGLKPADVLPLSTGVAALIALWVGRGRLMSRYRYEVTHDRRTRREYERRGFF